MLLFPSELLARSAAPQKIGDGFSVDLNRFQQLSCILLESVFICVHFLRGGMAVRRLGKANRGLAGGHWPGGSLDEVWSRVAEQDHSPFQFVVILNRTEKKESSPGSVNAIIGAVE